MVVAQAVVGFGLKMYELHDILIRCNVHDIYEYNVGFLPQSIQQTREVGQMYKRQYTCTNIILNTPRSRSGTAADAKTGPELHK